MKFLLVLLSVTCLTIAESKSLGANGYDLPGQDIICVPTFNGNSDQCRSLCYSTPTCTHYTWYFRDYTQQCCIKSGPRSYSSKVARPDLAPLVSEILGVHGYDLPGQDISCDPNSSSLSPDDCRAECIANPKCSHYSWYFQNMLQQCCLKSGPRTYGSKVYRPEFAPIVSELIVRE